VSVSVLAALAAPDEVDGLQRYEGLALWWEG
jgi:hypothetical protein